MQCEIAENEPGCLAGLQQRRGVRDRLGGGFRATGRRGNERRRVGLFPVPVGRRDHRADLAGLGERRGLRAEFAEVGGAQRFLRPVRHRAGQIGQTAADEFVVRIVRLMIGGVRADDIDDRRIRAARVVQHGDAVGEAAAHMQQREGGRSGHAGVAVRGAGHDVLLQAQDGTHVVGHPDLVDELHLGRAGIGEARRYARVHQRLEQRLSPVQWIAPRSAAAARRPQAKSDRTQHQGDVEPPRIGDARPNVVDITIL